MPSSLRKIKTINPDDERAVLERVQPPPRCVIFLNGPPGSGKDTAAGFIVKKYNATRYNAVGFSIAAPLKSAVHSFLCIDDPVSLERKHGYAYKDTPQSAFFGHTPRRVYQSISQDWAKKIFSPEVFGLISVRRMHATMTARMFVITDSGFLEEAYPIIDFVKPKHVLHIHLHREGCSFERDTRSYWKHPDVEPVVLKNDYEGDLEMYEHQVLRVVDQWLQSMS